MAMQHSETITKLMGAMLSVQGAVQGVAKDATNPHFKRSYASLESVVDAIRPACQAAGLVVMQAPGEVLDGAITVETLIAHAASGEWIRSAISLPLAKADPQGAGSAITYAERYSLMALFNLPPVDDDGEEASRPAPRPAASSNGRTRAFGAGNAGSTPAAATTDQARKLADLVYATTTGDDLSDLIKDPDFRSAYEGLDEQGRALVLGARDRQRAKLLAPMGAS